MVEQTENIYKNRHMNTLFQLLIFLLPLAMGLTACGDDGPHPQQPPTEQGGNASNDSNGNNKEPMDTKTISIKVGGQTLTVALADNSSARALVDKLKEGDLTIKMEDYSNFEKVGPLGFSLPTNDTQITTGPGDVILYQGRNLVIYYDRNSWSFTRLGKIEGATRQSLLSVLGNGDVTVTLSIK